jgi:hypothetical protein
LLNRPTPVTCSTGCTFPQISNLWRNPDLRAMNPIERHWVCNLRRHFNCFVSAQSVIGAPIWNSQQAIYGLSDLCLQ